MCHVGLGRLCLGVEGTVVPYQWDRFAPNRWPISLLKSGIQKAVRRSLIPTALALTGQVILQGRDDFLALVRRLSIICIEDAVPHEDLPFVVWLMSVMGRGWQPGAEHLERVGHFVEDLAGCPWRFARRKATLEDMHDQTLPEDPLTVACMIRSCYGGTKGDLRLLRGVPWHLFVQKCPRVARYSSVLRLGGLAPEHRICEAVDFHCCPNMIRDIKRDLPHIAYNKKQLREAIWHARSGFTNKTIYMTKREVYLDESQSIHEAIFREIENYVRDYANTYWAKGVTDYPVAPKRYKQASIDSFFSSTNK